MRAQALSHFFKGQGREIRMSKTWYGSIGIGDGPPAIQYFGNSSFNIILKL